MTPRPDFEYDPIKNRWNASKHDITLATATELWLDPNRHHDRAKIVQGEHRYALIARRHEKIWRCVFTLRAGKLRLISCRRARPKEIARYHRRGT